MNFPRRKEATNKELILTIIEIQGFLSRYGKTHTNWHETLNEVIERLEWIPVSERLPEICEEDCHGNITFSKTVLTTQIYGDGYVHVGIDKYTTNNGGGWLMEVPFDNPEECCEVIAWMPLPEPYKPTDSEKEWIPEWLPQYEGKWVAESEDKE